MTNVWCMSWLCCINSIGSNDSVWYDPTVCMVWQWQYDTIQQWLHMMTSNCVLPMWNHTILAVWNNKTMAIRDGIIQYRQCYNTCKVKCYITENATQFDCLSRVVTIFVWCFALCCCVIFISIIISLSLRKTCLQKHDNCCQLVGLMLCMRFLSFCSKK